MQCQQLVRLEILLKNGKEIKVLAQSTWRIARQETCSSIIMARLKVHCIFIRCQVFKSTFRITEAFQNGICITVIIISILSVLGFISTRHVAFRQCKRQMCRRCSNSIQTCTSAVRNSVKLAAIPIHIIHSIEVLLNKVFQGKSLHSAHTLSCKCRVLCLNRTHADTYIRTSEMKLKLLINNDLNR